MKIPDYPNWGESSDEIRSHCKKVFYYADAVELERVSNMATELNNFVLSGGLSKEEASDEWRNLYWIEKLPDYDAFVDQSIRRNNLIWKVDEIYREPIDFNKLPNTHAYNKVMAWHAQLIEGHGLSDIEVKKLFSKGLICFGKTGMAKSRSVYARLIQLYVDHDIDFIATMATQLKASIINAAFKGPQYIDAFVRECMTTRILFIDDVCKISLTPRFGEELYRIIEHRVSGYLRPIIITTQLRSDELVEKWVGSNTNLQDIAKAIVRRLTEFCDPVDFDFNPIK